MTKTLLESRRVALQKQCDAAKTQLERNQLGQFATPGKLADDILVYAKSLLGRGISVRFLDPALGTGSFYGALDRVFPRKCVKEALGFEIDPHYALPSQQLWANYPLRIVLSDFTKALPPSPPQFNLVICNPPYVRHHHLAASEKKRLQRATSQAADVSLSGLAGFYCHFLLLAHSWMCQGGVAGWLIPSEFMDVNYGKAVKDYLLDKVTLLRIHRFDPMDLQFEDALVSSAIVWFRNERPSHDHEVEFSYGGSLESPRQQRLVPTTALRGETKWTRFPSDTVRTTKVGPKLSDFFSVKRGLATGDNNFFIMSREQIESRGLPFELFRPILPAPRYLTTDQVDADATGLPLGERQLFLLDCRQPEEEIRTLYPRLWTYLDSAKDDVGLRYLCRSRSPWYAQEKRPPAPYVCTYMGRMNTANENSFRFIWNRSRATAGNVYLMLYPKPEFAALLDNQPELQEQVWRFLSDIDQKSLRNEGRVYGGGLYKMEPRELGNVPADGIANLWSDFNR